jgi:deoxyribose-phosphate aldolase
MENKKLAKSIDYTNLYNQTTRKEINKLIDESIEFGFGGICVAPCWTSYVANKLNRLKVSDILVSTVPNWKMGGGLEQMEGIAESCCESCDEVDYVLNTYEFGELKAYDRTAEELKTIREMTKGKLKVIIEAYYLRVSDEKIHKQGMDAIVQKACELVEASGADWIKTDSSLFKRPDFDSLVEDCKLMLKYSKLPVKAAGGIVNRYQAETLVNLGVKRIGTSKAVQIITSDANVSTI